MSQPDIRHGDCLDVLRTLPAASVDAIVTDPPYELAFMGRQWDASGIAYNIDLWRECLRVLKPGGHLAAFGGTRTYHRMACAVEDAGFEIRDGLTWLYGSGFPKSLDVGKVIDKIGGIHPNWNPTAYDEAVRRSGRTHADVDRHLDIKASSCYWARTDHRAATPLYRHWALARDFLGLDDDFASVASEAAREITQEEKRPLVSGDVISFDQRGSTERERRDIPATDAARQWQGWGTALKPAQEPIVLARKPLSGTVAANVLAHGTGALNIDGARVVGQVPVVPQSKFGGSNNNVRTAGRSGEMSEAHSAGRWPANVLLSHGPDCGDVCPPGCPVAELDAQSGTLRARGNTSPTKRGTAIWGNTGASEGPTDSGDSGGASRFFPTFRYQAKAPTKERPKVDGIAHPTVKPLGLMRWLVRLVTPPGGLVLDPFAGSGTTIEAALLEGFDVIGIEREADYLPLIQHRIDRAQTSLTARQALAEAAPSLFDLVGDDDAA